MNFCDRDVNFFFLFGVGPAEAVGAAKSDGLEEEVVNYLK